MAEVLNIPSKQDAQTVTAPIEVSTKVNGESKETTFEAALPKSLADAIAIYGEKDVFRSFMSSLVIKLQGEKRTELQKEGGAGKERKRASYLEAVGL